MHKETEKCEYVFVFDRSLETMTRLSACKQRWVDTRCLIGSFRRWYAKEVPFNLRVLHLFAVFIRRIHPFTYSFFRPRFEFCMASNVWAIYRRGSNWKTKPFNNMPTYVLESAFSRESGGIRKKERKSNRNLITRGRILQTFTSVRLYCFFIFSKAIC